MIDGVELDVDAISDGTDWCVPGILEQLDPPGIHSGDSVAVVPPQTLSRERQEAAAEAAGRIALALGLRGILNVQMIVAARSGGGDRGQPARQPHRADRGQGHRARRGGGGGALRAGRLAGRSRVAARAGSTTRRWSPSRRPSVPSGGCRAWIGGWGPRCDRPVRCWAWRRTTPPPWRPRGRPRRCTWWPGTSRACHPPEIHRA